VRRSAGNHIAAVHRDTPSAIHRQRDTRWLRNRVTAHTYTYAPHAYTQSLGAYHSRESAESSIDSIRVVNAIFVHAPNLLRYSLRDCFRRHRYSVFSLILFCSRPNKKNLLSRNRSATGELLLCSRSIRLVAFHLYLCAVYRLSSRKSLAASRSLRLDHDVMANMTLLAIS